jgi:hypothetical protein
LVHSRTKFGRISQGRGVKALFKAHWGVFTDTFGGWQGMGGGANGRGSMGKNGVCSGLEGVCALGWQAWGWQAIGKRQKIGRRELESTPHPSKKKSFSVWGSSRRIAI